jgi:hypothetical protein
VQGCTIKRGKGKESQMVNQMVYAKANMKNSPYHKTANNTPTKEKPNSAKSQQTVQSSDYSVSLSAEAKALSDATVSGGASGSVNADPPPPTVTNPASGSPPGNVQRAANPTEVHRLWNKTNQAGEALMQLIRSMLGNSNASGQGFWAQAAGGGMNISEADRLQAQQMIGEDGFFGVRQTKERIMGFAKALVGEDASEEEIESMRAAVQKGFDQVARMFGGFNNLPQVSRDTHTAIMQAFDDWVARSRSQQVA